MRSIEQIEMQIAGGGECRQVAVESLRACDFDALQFAEYPAMLRLLTFLRFADSHFGVHEGLTVAEVEQWLEEFICTASAAVRDRWYRPSLDGDELFGLIHDASLQLHKIAGDGVATAIVDFARSTWQCMLSESVEYDTYLAHFTDIYGSLDMCKGPSVIVDFLAEFKPELRRMSRSGNQVERLFAIEALLPMSGAAVTAEIRELLRSFTSGLTVANQRLFIITVLKRIDWELIEPYVEAIQKQKVQLDPTIERLLADLVD